MRFSLSKADLRLSNNTDKEESIAGPGKIGAPKRDAESTGI